MRHLVKGRMQDGTWVAAKMLKSHRECPLIREGDMVVFYIDMFSDVVRAGGQIHNRLGRFPHEDIIGLPFGSKVLSTGNAAARDRPAFMYALRPSTNLWTVVLPHRTQIIYHADMAFIMQKLDIRAGSIVVESGTGSGSFTHNLAKAVAPTGHVYTFDFHEQRAQSIRAQLEEHRFSELVTASHRNVCRDGFGITADADAVFLDLPAPWEAVVHAKRALKTASLVRICCFSPCIEQVQRTIAALKEHGFDSVEMYSCLLREWDIRRVDAVEYPANRPAAERGFRKRAFKEESSEKGVLVSQPKPEMRGHTSFLTFAVLHPRPAQPQQ